MYAIVDISGRQYNVTKGDFVEVERIVAKPGSDITFNKVLTLWEKNKLSVGNPYLKEAKIIAEVLGEVKGPKKISYKYRRRTASSHTKRGHRQVLTRLRIKEIETGKD